MLLLAVDSLARCALCQPLQCTNQPSSMTTLSKGSLHRFSLASCFRAEMCKMFNQKRLHKFPFNGRRISCSLHLPINLHGHAEYDASTRPQSNTVATAMSCHTYKPLQFNSIPHPKSRQLHSRTVQTKHSNPGNGEANDLHHLM